MTYEQWKSEVKENLSLKPHLKVKWKDSTFKKSYENGVAPKQAAWLCTV